MSLRDELHEIASNHKSSLLESQIKILREDMLAAASKGEFHLCRTVPEAGYLDLITQLKERFCVDVTSCTDFRESSIALTISW